MSVTGIPGQGPVRVGVAVTDIMAGAFLAQGILIALLDREVSGEGRWVQTSLIEAGITLLDFQATRWTMDKRVPPQEGNFHPTNTPMGLYPTADGFLNLAATSNKNFKKFCKLIDREKMASDPRFASPALRGRNKEALNELIANALRAIAGRHCIPRVIIRQAYDVRDAMIARIAVLMPHHRWIRRPSKLWLRSLRGRSCRGLQRRQHRLGNIRGAVAAAEFHRLDSAGIGLVHRALDAFAGFGGAFEAVLVGEPVQHHRGRQDHRGRDWPCPAP